MEVNKGGAPKGNQNAKGHGRPPNDGFTDDELIQLGQELLKWVNENPSAIHFYHWYSKIKGIKRSQWISICKRPCFVDFYAHAREGLGANLLVNKEIHHSYGSRFLPVYLKELDEFEQTKSEKSVDYALSRKKDLDKQETGMPNDTLLDQISSLSASNYKLLMQNEKLNKMLEAAGISPSSDTDSPPQKV